MRKENLVKKIITITFFIFLTNFSFAIDYQKDQFRLTLNMHILSGYRFTTKETLQVTQQETVKTTLRRNTFYIPRTYLDFRLRYGELFYGRVYYDISPRDWYSFDLYVGLTPTKEMEIRFGKFKQSLGYEVDLSAH
ncbi:MAG: hypothetical protein NZ608_07635, partial [candidate division WOR-3 bacterium]|nr:hypothetical protein [candidate division WOR-3 bacterium]